MDDAIVVFNGSILKTTNCKPQSLFSDAEMLCCWSLFSEWGECLSSWWLDIAVVDEVTVMKRLKGKGQTPYFPLGPSLQSYRYRYETGSLLVILFLLLLNLTIVLCMQGDITAVSIRLLKRLPLLGIAWRLFPLSHWAGKPCRAQ